MTLAVDPGTGLLDNVDYIYLAGATGLHARFLEIYDTVNGHIDADNMDLTDEYNFTGVLKQNGRHLVRGLGLLNSVNGKIVGTTTLYTVPTGNTAIITGCILRLTVVTALTGTMTAGVGIAAGEDDIFPATVLTGFNALNHVYLFNTTGKRVAATSGQAIKLGIDVAFGGTTATMDAQLIGWEY